MSHTPAATADHHAHAPRPAPPVSGPTHPRGTVAVTGATGFVGREVVRELLAAGWAVRALVRTPSKALEVLPDDPRLTTLQGHILDARSPQALVRGADAVIHLVGIIRERRTPASEGGPQTFQRMHVEATAAMLEACTGAQPTVRRFLHMSALGVRSDAPAAYQRTKFEAERLVRRSGLDWTIFRPGLIHGPHGEFVRMAHRFCSGDAPPFFFIPYFTRRVEHDEGVVLGRVSFEPARVAPVFVGDVARAFVRALDRPQTIGEVINITGPEVLTWAQMMEFLRDHLPGCDTTLPVIGLPGTPHAVMARVAGRLGLGALFPFDEGQAYMAQEDSAADLSKLRALLDLDPVPFRPQVERYAPAMA
jgi:nucleoside-diphosphate-sugar epimerase